MEKGKAYQNSIDYLIRNFKKVYKWIRSLAVKVAKWFNKMIKKGDLLDKTSNKKREEHPWPAVVEVKSIEPIEIKRKKEDIERKRLSRIAVKTKKFRIRKKLFKRIKSI